MARHETHRSNLDNSPHNVACCHSYSRCMAGAAAAVARAAAGLAAAVEREAKVGAMAVMAVMAAI